MGDQLNFKQVPFDTMYYNNLSKQAGQVLIECDPNRTVLKIIESCITKNNTVLTDAELAQWIFRYHVQRTKNHVENVKLCANYLRDFFKFGEYFARFIAKVQHHDYDKLQGNEHVASFALNAPLYKYKDLYEISPESKRVYEEIEWVKHHMLNDHHPENYMHRPDPEKNQWVISDEELEDTYKDKGGHPAILMALGEMVADWAAVGIEMGDTAKDWWLRNKDKQWSYGPKYTQALEACLEWIPSKLYVQSSEPIPEPPKLKMNVTSNISEERISQAVVNNIKDGLVYHASPIKLAFLAGKHTGNWSGEQGNVFVTPVKGLAACFVINKNDVVDKAEQQLGGRLIGLNFGYDIWNKPIDKLRALPREIVVTLNVRGLKPFTGESTGYLYTIDYTKYADKTHMFRKNPNSDVEFLIEGDVHYKLCEKITIKWKCVSSEDDIKRHGEAKVDSETSLEKYDEQKLRDSVYSEETAHLVIRKESDINSISDLKAFFSHCKYGLVDISAGKLWSETHNNTTEQDYDDNWKLLSANELIKYKCGICYDTVLLTKTVFDRLNIKYKLFFAYCNKGDGPTHTFIIYQDSDRWRWLEGSWGSFKKNSFVSPNSNTLVSWIGKALANNAGIQQQILELNNYPKPGVTMKEFQHAVLRGSKWGLVNVDRTSQTSLETYDPPYTEQQMRDHGYSEDVIARLKNDPVHKWRMETGIELIHIEPTRTELKRIWKNWNQMTDTQKKISDRKCKELFGCDNTSLYEYLIPQYKVESPGKGAIKYPKNDTKESSISTEVMELLSDTVEEKRLTALAKPLYVPTGKNSWEHIQQDVGNAVAMVRAIKHRRLTLQEYATILFHDCAVKSRKSKDKHGLYSAELAKSILLKTEYFTEEAIEAICTAIVEHDFDTNPKSIYTSELSDLLASADFNPPNVAWILNKSYAWGLSKGFSHDECISNSLKTIPEKYGSHGTVVIPKLYGEFYKNQIPVMQRTFDKLTREECERIIMDYRKRHHLNDHDTSLPDPSLESVYDVSTTLSSVSDEGLFDPVVEDDMYYTIRNFPVLQFFNKLRKEYKTTKLEHLFKVIGIRFFFAQKRTINIHKFFIPELLYLLDKFQFPVSLINTIKSNTWVGTVVQPTESVDLSVLNSEINTKFYDHQIEFIKNYVSNKTTNHLRGYLLSFEQGLGKTITALGLMTALKKEHVVIICPKNTMLETWNAHLIKFFNQKQEVWIAGYTKGPLVTSYRWIIVNYERIDEVKEFLIKNKLNNLGVIVDESHNFLRTSSQRTQLLIDLVKYNQSADILMMSGTPIKCVGNELLPIMQVLDPYCDEEAITIFKRTFGFNTSIANDVLNARLDRMMTRVRKDILDLPEKKETTINVRMPTGWKYTASQVEKEIVDFVKKRQDYYNQNLQSYLDAFEEVIEWLRDEPTVGGQPEFQRYLSIIGWLRESNISDARGNADIVWANQYEKDVLIPALPEDLRKQFIWSKSVVKYLPLKIKGEVIGQLLTRLRMQMTSEMMQAAELKQYVDNAMKKTVVFTSYVDTIELVYNYFQKEGYSPLAVYGKTSSELTNIVKRFQEDQSLNPLIASLKMLSTGATLTAANTVIFLNKPWRSIEYQQASDRVHRIGQDTDCEIISLVLDTGKEANLSTRMEDIMQWSGDQFDQIVDKKEREEVKTFFRGFESLDIPDDCIVSEESHAVVVKNPGIAFYATNERLRRYIRPQWKGEILLAKSRDHAIISYCRSVIKKYKQAESGLLQCNYDAARVYGGGNKVIVPCKWSGPKNDPFIKKAIEKQNVFVYEFDTTDCHGEFTAEAIEHGHILRYEGEAKDLPITRAKEYAAVDIQITFAIDDELKSTEGISMESFAMEAQSSSTPSDIAQKKKKILDYICKLCDTMEPSGLNSKRYRQIIGQMNDKEFDRFMNYMKEGKWQLHLVAPNMIVNLQNEDLLKACDMIGLDLFQRVWMYDRATGRKYLTDNKYMFVKLPIRRQQQFLDEKISVPDNDRTIDGLTGQVTGDSRACSITNPEIQILAARGLDKTMQELVNVRGGNIHGYSEFRRMLEENGEADLDMIDPNSRTRASVVGGKLLQSMMLDTNL